MSIGKVKKYLKWLLVILFLLIVGSGAGYVSGVAQATFVRIGGFSAYLIPIVIVAYLVVWGIGKAKS